MSMLVCSICCCLSLSAWAQPAVGDTLPTTSAVDTAAQVADTLTAIVAPPPPIVVQPDTLLPYFYQLHPLLPIQSPVIYRLETNFEPPQQDRVFYWLAGLLLLLGIIRMGFAKYFTDLIRIFTHTAIQ
ncbi:MAG: hypothetical protein IT252_03980, partial [Chitinophagaceae bacterium]|nr:hypothetical protein [Chitinophagaceae bacterium]